MRDILRVFTVKTVLKTFLSDESGVTAVEYGVISALISVVIIGAVSSLGTHLKTTFSTVAASI
jgi:pilus assembly protein Flp/PilA